MTKKLIATSLAIALLTIGSFAANATQRHGGDADFRCRDHTAFRDNGDNNKVLGPRHEMFAEILGLTQEQQERIETIRQETRTAHQALREQLREYHDQLRDLTNADTLDEEAIRTIAEQKAAVQTELLISRAQVHRETLAIMTPEQQELAERLRAVRQNNRGNHKRDHGRRW